MMATSAEAKDSHAYKEFAKEFEIVLKKTEGYNHEVLAESLLSRVSYWLREVIGSGREIERLTGQLEQQTNAVAMLETSERVDMERLRKIEDAARKAVIAYDDKLGASWRNSCEALREALNGDAE